jgi:hypothetical protein
MLSGSTTSHVSLGGFLYLTYRYKSAWTLNGAASDVNQEQTITFPEYPISMGLHCAPCSRWPCGRTALRAAAGGGHIAVVERLLKEKADANAAAAARDGGRTTLQAAAVGGHLAVVERLLQDRLLQYCKARDEPQEITKMRLVPY